MSKLSEIWEMTSEEQGTRSQAALDNFKKTGDLGDSPIEQEISKLVYEDDALHIGLALAIRLLGDVSSGREIFSGIYFSAVLRGMAIQRALTEMEQLERLAGEKTDAN